MLALEFEEKEEHPSRRPLEVHWAELLEANAGRIVTAAVVTLAAINRLRTNDQRKVKNLGETRYCINMHFVRHKTKIPSARRKLQ